MTLRPPSASDNAASHGASHLPRPRELVAYPTHAGVLRHFDALASAAAEGRGANVGGVVLGNHACTFAELVGEVMHAALPDSRTATPLERRLLVLRSLGELGDLPVPAPGLLDAAEDALRACLRSGALAETVLRVAEAPEGKRPRLRRLGKLLKAYEKANEAAGLLDPDRALWSAARALADGAPLPALLTGLERVIVRGVVQLSRAELALLHNLSLHLTPDTEVVLEVPHMEGVNAYRMVTRLHERFAEFGGDGVIELRSVEPCPSSGGTVGETVARALIELERTAPGGASTDPATEPASGDGLAASGGVSASSAVGWLVAPDPRAEARMAAIFLRGLLEGTPADGSATRIVPERVVVITRAPADGRAVLEDALEEAGVPVERERMHRLGSVPLVRFVVDVVRAAATGWTTEDVANVLESGYAHRWVSEGRGELVQRLRAIRLPQQTGSSWFAALGAQTEPGSATAGPGDGEGSRAALRSACLRVADTFRQFEGELPLSDFLGAVDALIADAALDEVAVLKGSPPPRLARLLVGEGSRLSLDEAAAFGRDQRALEALREALREWRAASAQVPLAARPAEEWATLLASWVSGVTLFGATGGAGGVRVVTPDSAVLGDFDAAVVAGLEHGVFPGAPRESAFLRHEDAKALAGEVELRSAFDVWGDGLTEPFRGGEEVDRVTFLSLLAAVRGPLLLSRSAVDADGGVVLASEFFLACERAFPGARRVDLEAAAAGGGETVAVGYGRALRQAVLRTRAGVPSGTSPTALLAMSKAAVASVDPNSGSTVVARAQVERGRLARSLGAAAGELGPWEGRTEPLPDLASHERPLSVTAAENAVACGFRFFAANVLRLRAEGSATFDPDNREQGTASHEAFAAAIEVLQRRGLVPFEPARAEAALVAAEPRVREVIETRSVSDGARPETRARNVERLVREVLGVLRALYEGDERGWSPAETEWSFGDGRDARSAPPLSVKLRDGTLAHFGGRVDFLERNGDAWRVSDLKSTKAGNLEGTKGPLHATRFGHSSLQLPVYMAKVAEHRSATKVSARYLSLTDGVAVERSAPPTRKGAAKDAYLPDEEVTRLARADGSPTVLASTLAELVEDARAGQFPAAPIEGACDFCDFRALCRRPMGAAAEDEGE